MPSAGADEGGLDLASVANLKSVASRVVNQSARVGPGDRVLLSGDVADFSLLEDLAVEVRKQGGDPLISVGTERLSRRLYDEVPARYDAQRPALFGDLLEHIDVFIGTESNEGRTLKGVPVERLTARAKVFSPILESMRRRGVRSVSLGNGLYPTAERAEQYDMPREKLAKLMYSGIDADYAGLQTRGEALRRTLAGGKTLRVTNGEGTDITMQITGRKAGLSDGVISSDDRKEGGAATSVWLPAGEVYLIPVPGTAEGSIVANHLFLDGGRIDELRLEIRKGKLVSMESKSDLTRIKQFQAAGGPGRDEFALIDFGINPAIQLSSDAPVNVWSRAGAVTLGIGNNLWAGGTNNSTSAISLEVSKATVTLDGVPIVKEGVLVGSPTATATGP